MIVIHVLPGQTLSGIASAHGESLAAVESANPQISDPNVIYVGEQVIVPSGGSFTSWTPVSSSTGSTGGGGYHIPGMSDALASCIAFHESTNGQASGNVFQITPGSGYSGAGSLAQQEQTAGTIWANQGPSAWAADAGVCPGA
jgi:hypothetical protein